MLGTVVLTLLSGFIIGGLARWAVPGPDPMPVWLTILFGLAGSTIGGAVAVALIGGTKDLSSSDFFLIAMAEIVATILLLVGYRRLVQKRPLTGPEAHKPPTRGWGLSRRGAGRLPTLSGPRTPRGTSKQAVLEKLDELHDQGALTDEEYLAKRREVLRWD